MIRNKINPSFPQSECDCGTCHSRCASDASWSSTRSSISRENFALTSNGHGEIVHKPSVAVQKPSRHLSPPSSTMEMKSCSTSPEFFLRPHLTRGEYAYWNSRFCCVSSTRACASNPTEDITVTYQHRTPSVCVRNSTGIPYCDEQLPSSGVPAVHSQAHIGSTENTTLTYQHSTRSVCVRNSTGEPRILPLSGLPVVHNHGHNGSTENTTLTYQHRTPSVCVRNSTGIPGILPLSGVPVVHSHAHSGSTENTNQTYQHRTPSVSIRNSTGIPGIPPLSGVPVVHSHAHSGSTENTTLTYEHRTPSVCVRNSTGIPYCDERFPSSGVPAVYSHAHSGSTENTSQTYQHRTPSVCVRNSTGIPYCDERLPSSGVPVVHSHAHSGSTENTTLTYQHGTPSVCVRNSTGIPYCYERLRSSGVPEVHSHAHSGSTENTTLTYQHGTPSVCVRNSTGIPYCYERPPSSGVPEVHSHAHSGSTENTTLTYQHRTPSVCVRNSTGIPYCDERLPSSGVPEVHSHAHSGSTENTTLTYQHRTPSVCVRNSTGIPYSDERLPSSGVPVVYSHAHSGSTENTTLTYQHRNPSVCVRNSTGIPGILPLSGVPVVPSPAFSENCCSNARNGPMASFPEMLPSIATTSHEQETMTASVPGCSYPANTNFKESTGQYIFRDEGIVGDPSSLERFVPPTSQVENRLDRSSCCDITGDDQAKLRKNILKGHLCEYQSFGEKPSSRSLTSSSSHEGVNHSTGSADICDSTGKDVVHPDLSSTDLCPVKRKPRSTSEHVGYLQGKFKRQCVGDYINGIHDAEAANETSDVNPPISNSCDNDASFNINESRDTRRSREITKPPNQDSMEKITSGTITSGNITSGTVREPGSTALTEAQPIIIDLTDDNNNAEVKQRVLEVGDQAPNGRDKPPERKDIDDVIKTVKPVQRRLLNNGRASVSDGCALDHDSMPRLIGVLPSAMATAISSLRK
ncbi:hypothetical protein OS493_022901 [Desmophyllum pertusum]|uniref:Uncharacterized protein n=1 Tax=Desmophyllum pertusum TaxID=174260 RepID=A0A9X0D206_9CNID|nr:hypothetical protein OS493_022901 [Desmophyllum pertusum]